MDTPFQQTPCSPESFDIVDERGRRLRVLPASDSDTVRDLAAAARIACLRDSNDPSQQYLLIDDRPVSARTRLSASGIRHGASLTTAPNDDPSPRSPVKRTLAAAQRLDAVWIAGPDAGGTFAIAPGDNVIGRSVHADIRCSDRSIELHQAILRCVDNTITVTQMAGTLPIMIDARPIVDGQEIACGAVIELGGSLLEIRHRVSVGGLRQRPDPMPNDPWRVAFVRRPRAVPDLPPLEIEVPGRSHSTTAPSLSVVGPLIGVGAAAIIALLMQQVMFLVFSAIGLVVAVATWIAGRAKHAKDHRGTQRGDREQTAHFIAALEAQRAMYRQFHHATVTHLDLSLRLADTASPKLWSVRSNHVDAFRVSIGRGTVAWKPNVSGVNGDTPAHIRNAIDCASELRDIDVAVTLGPGVVLGIAGPVALANSVARSLLVQLAVASGPADWACAAITARSPNDNEWRWVDWLGHRIISTSGSAVCTTNDLLEAVASDGEDNPRHLVIIVQDQRLLASRTHPLRRLIASHRSLAVVVLCGDEIPAVCTHSLIVGRDCRGKWDDNPHAAGFATPVHVCGLSLGAAERVACRLACLVDPERHVAEAHTVPAYVGLIALLHPQIGDDSEHFATRIAARWRSEDTTNDLRVAVGRAADGLVEIDLVDDGPHGLIAGTTGSGKSELLRTLVVGLAANYSPERVNFVLVDYKGGSTFDACTELPHVVGLVTDLDDGLAARAVRSLEAELRRRETLMRVAAATDLVEYRATRGPDIAALPSLVVVIDEFATLAKHNPDFIGALLGIAQRGRSLGVHLILATQRPHGVVTDDIRANTNLRISLRVQDVADSVDVIGDPQAAHLNRHARGRGVVRLGADEPFVFQAAHCLGAFAPRTTQRLQVEGVDATHEPAKQATEIATNSLTELSTLVRAIRIAAKHNGYAPPYRPWIPELPIRLHERDVAPTDIGIIDDPDRQRRMPLSWAPEHGNVLLVGAVGYGTTSALRAIIDSLLARDHLTDGDDRAAPTHVYLIDATGDRHWDALQRAAQCAGVIRATDTERLGRLCSRLFTELNRRKSLPGDDRPQATIVVCIDGFGSLRTSLMNDDNYEWLQQLEAVVAEGQAVGMCVALTATHASALAMATLSHIAHRWVFHLADPAEASVLGVSARLVPAAIPGRLVLAREGLEAQIVDRMVEPPQTSSRALPEPIQRLPHTLSRHELPSGQQRSIDTVVPYGILFESLQPAAVELSPGDHFMVLGPSRSGRSEALLTLAAGWRAAHPDGWIGSLSPRRRAPEPSTPGFDSVGALLDAWPRDRACLIVADDAELIDDPRGDLAALIDKRGDGFTVIAAARPDSIRSMYGHWTQSVRRSRLGLVMVSASDLDADLLHASIPRRLPIASRPGLAWAVAHSDVQLVQVARCTHDPMFNLTNTTVSDDFCTIS